MTPETEGVEPLTKRTADGKPYTRRAEVEQQIGTIVAERRFDTARLTVRDRNDSRYVFDETIVYLVRRARAAGDESLVETFYLEIDRRCVALLRKFRKFFRTQEDFEEFRNEVSSDVLMNVIDPDSNSADFAQIQFGSYVVSLARTKSKKMNAANPPEVALFSQLGGDGADDAPYESLLDGHFPDIERQLIRKQAIGRLPDKIRYAAILHYVEGWKIESRDPEEITVSRFFDVTERTVRNWMRTAEAVLAAELGGLKL